MLKLINLGFGDVKFQGNFSLRVKFFPVFNPQRLSTEMSFLGLNRDDQSRSDSFSTKSREMSGLESSFFKFLENFWQNNYLLSFRHDS